LLKPFKYFLTQMMKTKPTALCIAVLLTLAMAACDTGHSNRVAVAPLDGGHRDRIICTMVDTIEQRLPDRTSREQPPPQSEQVVLDVAAILSGMQRPGVPVRSAALQRMIP
jgi:hypothetical protein